MKKSTAATILGLVVLTAIVGGNAYDYYTRAAQKKDPERIKRTIEFLAPTVTPEKPEPLSGTRIPFHPDMPTGSFVIDFMRTDFMTEKKIPKGYPKAVAAGKAVQRVQFDVLGKTSGGELKLAYRLQKRWRGKAPGDSLTGFARPFTVVFHDPQAMRKNGIGFSVTGFDTRTGEVYIGPYDKTLPILYVKQGEHVTLLCCSAEKKESSLVLDTKVYASDLRHNCRVYTDNVRSGARGVKRPLPVKQLKIADRYKYMERG